MHGRKNFAENNSTGSMEVTFTGRVINWSRSLISGTSNFLAACYHHGKRRHFCLIYDKSDK